MDDLPTKHSYSGFSVYTKCGKQYELEKVSRVTRRPAWWFAGGNVIHEWSEIYDRGNQPPPIQRMFLEAVQKEEEKSGVHRSEWLRGGRVSKEFPDKEAEAFWLDELPKMAMRYVSWRKTTGWEIWEANGVPAIELPVEFKLGEVEIRGFIDRVFVLPRTGEQVVLDLKSGSRTPDNVTQLGLYATAIQLLYGPRPRWGYYWMARKGGHTPPVDLDFYTPALMAEQFRQFNLAVQNRIFLPVVGGHCRTCPVQEFCYAGGGGSKALEADPLAKFDAPF